MNHNPYDLKLNDLVWLDVNYVNKSKVTIKEFTFNKTQTTISFTDKGKEKKWIVMTSRLSPIKD